MSPWRVATVWLLFVLLPLGLIGWKMAAWGYSTDNVVPWRGYRVVLEMGFDGHGDSIMVRTFLPGQDKRQHSWNEAFSAGRMERTIQRDRDGNRVLRAVGREMDGEHSLRVRYSVLCERVEYRIDPEMGIEAAFPGEDSTSLDSTEMIEVGHPEIAALLGRIAPERAAMLPVLRAVFSYARDSVTYRSTVGSTDALATLRLGEANCTGKSRLMVALLRQAGIPARLVGGLILEKGSKRTSHQWLEAGIGGFWIPFCPTNGHFASIPERYLALYRGDHALFRHTSNINFDYSFRIEPILVGKDEIGLGGEQLGSIAGLWDVFGRVGLDLGVLKYLLLVPVGGLVTVVFRNILGLEPFGTFLPALIAAAADETGLLWGVAGFFLVILLCSGVRYLLEGFQLTRTPKLAILMVTVVATMLALTWVGLRLDLVELSQVSLFPLVVLTMTVERFSRAIVEDGARKALDRSLVTAAAIACCFAVIDLKVVQLFFLAFPEGLLLLVAVNFWIGRWAGVRLTEYWRFRHMLWGKA